ncbi:MAG TPA: OmpA family protein [Thermoanaerobaculaceae bacterium]|nr:OmpA family protein [Thermoanaerobaculaceae bacterium]
MRKSLWVVLVVGLLVTLGVTGCATKTYVQEQVAAATKAEDAKIGEVQKQVEATQMDVTNLKKSDAAQNDQLAKLSDTAKEALDRANEANKLANHSFLFEVTLTDEAVHFGFNKHDLSADAKAALDAFAKRVKDENKNVYIEIQGHTDSIGSDKVNLTLGQWRADEVMRYLNMQQGFPLHRMNAVSYGKFKPIADNKTAEGRAKNRRVTLVVLY